MFKPTKPQHIVNKKYVDENSGGGSGEKLIVNMVYDPETEITTSDKTFGEIREAMDNGTCVLFHSSGSDSEQLVKAHTYEINKMSNDSEISLQATVMAGLNTYTANAVGEDISALDSKYMEYA